MATVIAYLALFLLIGFLAFSALFLVYIHIKLLCRRYWFKVDPTGWFQNIEDKVVFFILLTVFIVGIAFFIYGVFTIIDEFVPDYPNQFKVFGGDNDITNTAYFIGYILAFAAYVGYGDRIKEYLYYKYFKKRY